MNFFVKIFSLLLFVLAFALTGFAQSSDAAWSKDPFHHEVFIENKGQFNGENDKKNSDIKYMVSLDAVQFYFTPNGLTYRHNEFEKREEERDGEKEDKKDEKPTKRISYLVHMDWQGANPDARIIAQDSVSYYFTYADLTDKTGNTTIKASAFKKIIYKDLYPDIDVEYIFPEGKTGIEYSLILHPGADISAVKMKYSGSKNISADAKGNIQIKTSFGDIIDHAPVSFYADSKSSVASSFKLDKGTVSFALGNYDKSKTLIVDPWTMVPTFATYNGAYDIDYDYAGNVYVYGGVPPFQEIKLNSAGVFQWVYTTNAFMNSPFNSYYGDFAIDGLSGISYVCEGLYSSNGARMVKLNTGGTQMAFWNGNIQLEEFWRIVYDNCTKQIVIAGGGVSNSNQACTIDNNLTTLTAMNILSTSEIAHDMCLVALDNSNNCYMATTNYGNPALNNVMVKCPVPALLPLAFNVPDGYSFTENGTNTYINGGVLPTKGFSGMAVSPNFLYTYDGTTAKRWNKTTGALINSGAISPASLVQDGGLVVDDCDHIFAGVQTSIKQYDINFNVISTIAAPNTVCDVKLDLAKNLIYACGKQFVGAFAVNVSCTTGSMTVTATASGSCTSGSATVNVTGGTPAYTYQWNPSGQTNQTATGLSTGTYTVTVTDAACIPHVQTATVSVTTSSLTSSVTATPAICLAANGSATVTPNGGTAPYTYAWSPTGGNNAVATGLTAGTYTVSVTDATGCSGTATVVVTVSGGPTLTAAQTNVLCNGGASGTATVTPTGGTAPYTYAWSPSGGASSAATGLSAGTYTATITDANGCKNTQTVTITQPTPIVSSATATPSGCAVSNGTAAATASGATSPYTYNWSPSGGNNAAATGLAPGNYTVTVSDANGCTSTATATVASTGGPTASAASNVTILPGNSTTLSAGGGGTYLWSEGSVTQVITVSPTVTTIYCVTVTDANNCTDTACVTVYIEPVDNCGFADEQLFVPDAFSPNGDTRNDLLGIYCPDITCIQDFVFVVYDRWGEKVFEATSIVSTWDGAYRGKVMNTAVFVYYMKAVLLSGREIVRHGNVSLIR